MSTEHQQKTEIPKQPESNPLTQNVLDAIENLIKTSNYIQEIFTNCTQAKIEELVVKRQKKTERTTKIVLAILTIVVTAFATSIFFGINQYINYRIKESLQENTEKIHGDIEENLEFNRFFAISTKLDIVDSYTKDDLNAIMYYLRKSASNASRIHDPYFETLLAQLMKAFGASGRNNEIDELFKLYNDILLRNETCVSILTDNYGRRLSGEISPDKEATLATFTLVERAAANHDQLSANALSYRIVYEASVGSPDETIQRTLLDSQSLPKEIQRDFLGWILSYTKIDNLANIDENSAPAYLNKFTREARNLFLRYPQIFSITYGLDENIFIGIGNNGISKLNAAIIVDRVFTERDLNQ